MKYFFLLMLFCNLAFGAPNTSIKAFVSGVVTDYSSTNVGTVSAVQILSSVPNPGVSMIDIFDSSGRTLQLTYTLNAVSTTVATIYPGGNGQIQTYIPVGAALYLKSLTTTANSGQSIINLYY